MSELVRIALLDNRLANQIAAGEVVERPASVVKELLENSIDAGATRIEIDIERGGTRLIRITDNGRGIHKEDMGLALTRHATSKISTTEDLASIQTLGFRGEALASISSVSRMTLTSRTQDSELAWQANAQGRDMAIDIQPAAAAPGSRIEVADLFFNTPARQKFLRTEKTEFNHIEEVFKRQALANFHIAFVLKHNHKMAKRVPACREPEQRKKRISAICGQAFVDNAIEFHCPHELVKISGWLGKPNYHRSESDIQYVFINGRPVKDKTLNHAIRQAYEGMLPAGRMATYIIYLQVNPAQVDVNVHPTKHEVRFSEQRLVHDLLAKSVADALQDHYVFSGLTTGLTTGLESTTELAHETTELAGLSERVTEPLANEYQQPLPRSSSLLKSQKNIDHSRQNHNSPVNRETFSYIQSVMNSQEPMTGHKVKTPPPTKSQLVEHDQNSSLENATAKSHSAALKSLPVQHLTGQYYFYIEDNNKYFVDFALTLNWFVLNLLHENIETDNRPLLFPKTVELSQALLEEVTTHDLLNKLGFSVHPEHQDHLQIRKIPNWLACMGNDFVFEKLSKWVAQSLKSSGELLAENIMQDLNEHGHYTDMLVESVLREVARLKESKKLLEEGIFCHVDRDAMSKIFGERK